MNLHLHMHLDILKNMETYVKKYSPNILRYTNIYANMQNIYLICHKKRQTMICETISCSMFQSEQYKNVLQGVQLLVTVYMKRGEIIHRYEKHMEKTL